MHVRVLYCTVLYIPFLHKGCSAWQLQDVWSFSVDVVNCQSWAVVEVTNNYGSTGTVCGTVDQATADTICESDRYGTAIDFGTAASKG